MKAVDTNVLLRLVVTTDVAQTQIAEEIAGQPIFVPLTVLVEFAWVLQSVYRFERVAIADTFLHIVALPTVVVEDEQALRWAIKRFRDFGADMADMLHLIAARGGDRFATFDRKMSRQAGEDAPVPVETLA